MQLATSAASRLSCCWTACKGCYLQGTACSLLQHSSSHVSGAGRPLSHVLCACCTHLLQSYSQSGRQAGPLSSIQAVMLLGQPAGLATSRAQHAVCCSMVTAFKSAWIAQAVGINSGFVVHVHMHMRTQWPSCHLGQAGHLSSVQAVMLLDSLQGPLPAGHSMQSAAAFCWLLASVCL